MSYTNQLPYKSYTTSQRTALTVPVGFKIYNTDFSMIEEWNGVDWAYLPLNGAPIVQNSLSCVCPVAINQQYFHMIAGFKDGTNTLRIPIPVGGFSIGDIIQFNIRRTPTGDNDTYEHDAIFIKAAMHVVTNDRGSTNRYNN
jgi:hypothetical protein